MKTLFVSLSSLLCIFALGITASPKPKRHAATLVVAKRSFIDQHGPFPTTTIFTPRSDGDFRISAYIEPGSIDGGTVNGQIGIQDDWQDGVTEDHQRVP